MKPQIKVGDRVRLTRSSWCVPSGHVDTVAAISGDKATLTKPDFNVELDALELVGAKDEAAYTFKVGDRVRVIDHRPDNPDISPTWNESMDSLMGGKGVVVEAGCNLKVCFSDGNWWWFNPSWLLPAEESNLKIHKPGTGSIVEAPLPPSDKAQTGRTTALPLISKTKLLTNIKLD